MGQYWEIVSPFSRTVMPKGRRKLGEFIFDVTHAVCLARLLAVATSPGAQGNGSWALGSACPNVFRPKTSLHGRVNFQGLPPEMIREIFDCVELIEDVVSLGMACSEFWCVAQPQITQYRLDTLGEWAGQKIICVGEYAGDYDYPDALFAEGQWEGLRRSVKFVQEGDVLDRAYPRDLYDYASNACSDPHQTFEGDRVKNESASIIENVTKRPGGLEGEPALAATKEFFDMKEADYYPTNETWILRNLTTKQFVRADAIALKPEYIHGPHVAGIGFGTVVMFRIAWSWDPSCAIGNIGNRQIHRGVWAGHEFDISTVTRHESLKRDDEAWTDVSEEVMQEISDIWEGDFGPEWKENVYAEVEYNPQWLDPGSLI